MNEAVEAGNQSHLAYAERLRQGTQMLEKIRTGAPPPPLTPGGAPGAAGASLTSQRTTHRSPSPQKESPVERTLRKQRLAAKMKR